VKRTALRSKSKTPNKKVRSVKKGYKTPAWFNAIPVGSHGNTPAQKRYWKVTSDFVRQRDFEKSKRCVSCSAFLDDWRDGDAAHYRAWSVCNAWFKYEVTNIALSCKNCNRLSDGSIGFAFGEELKKRHGEDHLKWIEKENLKHRGEKLEDWLIVERVGKMLDENPNFICP
jgi:hypothetical protein